MNKSFLSYVLMAATATIAVLILAIAGALVNRSRSSELLSVNCYSVQDSFGVWHTSFQPVELTENGLTFYQREPEWGIRGDFKGLKVDRECLRRRGVAVEPLQPTDQ